MAGARKAQGDARWWLSLDEDCINLANRQGRSDRGANPSSGNQKSTELIHSPQIRLQRENFSLATRARNKNSSAGTSNVGSPREDVFGVPDPPLRKGDISISMSLPSGILQQPGNRENDDQIRVHVDGN